jgi:ceramide glucosyltransferase
MIPATIQVIQILAAFGAVSSVGYYAVCLWSGVRFLSHRNAAGEGARPTLAFTPAVSILKQLRGTDPEMYESFRSHCLQDYPDYEIIFGISDENDPAIPLAERLKSEFPQRPIRLIICGENLGANVKVSNLAQWFARHVPNISSSMTVIFELGLTISSECWRLLPILKPVS